jgi:hypothetical protein
MKSTTSVKKSSTSTRSPKGTTFTRKNRTAFQSNDWVAYVYDENGKKTRTRAYEGSSSMSYSQIRTAYNNETKMRRFDDVRACRVSNF